MSGESMENNLVIRTGTHRAIYLSDLRKTETEKLKTVLRYCVKEIKKIYK
ncbi:hypothetical protein [Clostridium gasigenes]|nr:hypothetical protein [Clostridium gasigenes]MBU3105660.1 hypothetical protein [Clostridium gasigenes]